MTISVATQTAGDLATFTFKIAIDTIAPLDVSSADGATFHVNNLRVGTHTVALQGLNSACTSGQDSRQVSIVANDTIDVNFAVQCTPVTGEVTFTSTTTGEDIDPDGYLISYDQGLVFELDRNSSRRLIHVPPGDHTLEIFDVEPNCALTGSATRPVSIAAGQVLPISVDVVCTAVGAGEEGFAVTDPANDTLPNTQTGIDPALDLLAVTGRYVPGWLLLTLHFSAPVVASALAQPNSLYGFVDFDVDESQATGVAPGVNILGGSATQGVDYEVSFFSQDDATAEMWGLAGFLGLVATVYDDDSVTVRIPFFKMGNDDGNLSFSAVFGSSNRATDIAPNAGVLLARTPPGFFASGFGASLLGRGGLGTLNVASVRSRAPWLGASRPAVEAQRAAALASARVPWGSWRRWR
jgi:hypothetical protein